MQRSHFDSATTKCSHLLALALEVMGYCQYGQSTDMDSCIAMSGGELGPGFSINYTFVKALSNCEITIEGSIENVRQFISIHQPALTASVSTPTFSPMVDSDDESQIFPPLAHHESLTRALLCTFAKSDDQCIRGKYDLWNALS